MRARRGFPLLLLAHHGDLFGLALILQHHELVPGVGNTVESLHFHRHPRGHLFHLLTPVVEHGPHPAVLGAADEVVPHLQGALQHQDRAHRAPAFVQPGLDDVARGRHVGRGRKIQDFRLQQDLFQQFLDTDALLGGDLGEQDVAAPFLGDHAVVAQFPLDSLRVGIGFVDLVDRHHQGHPGGLGVVDGLHGLFHDAVVRGHHQDHQVGDLGAPGPHGGKGLMARGIQEDHLALALQAVSHDRRRCAG